MNFRLGFCFSFFLGGGACYIGYMRSFLQRGYTHSILKFRELKVATNGFPFWDESPSIPWQLRIAHAASIHGLRIHGWRILTSESSIPNMGWPSGASHEPHMLGIWSTPAPNQLDAEAKVRSTRTAFCTSAVCQTPPGWSESRWSPGLELVMAAMKPTKHGMLSGLTPNLWPF